MSNLGGDEGIPPRDDSHYRIAWAINPHMVPGSTDLDLARQQHRALARALTQAGAHLIEAPFVRGAYDSVFTKDAALLHARGQRCAALIARFRHVERAPESRDRAAFLAARGAEIVHAESYLEGGDVAVTNNSVYLGYGFRSDCRSAQLLSAHFERPVVTLRLVDARLYHLDVAFVVLPDGTALVCREAFTAESLRALDRSPGIREVVGVSVEDALTMCLNLVPVGDTLVGGNVSRRVSAVIAARGFRQHIVPLDQFHRAGGGAACLVSAVHAPRTQQRADEAVAA